MTPIGAWESGLLDTPTDDSEEKGVTSVPAWIVSDDASVSAAHVEAAYVVIVFMLIYLLI